MNPEQTNALTSGLGWEQNFVCHQRVFVHTAEQIATRYVAASLIIQKKHTNVIKKKKQ